VGALIIDDVSFGFSVNAKTKYGNTALHCAARKGHIECVKVLLAAGFG
jgi:ankyrin repeat protein